MTSGQKVITHHVVLTGSLQAIWLRLRMNPATSSSRLSSQNTKIDLDINMAKVWCPNLGVIVRAWSYLNNVKATVTSLHYIVSASKKPHYIVSASKKPVLPKFNFKHEYVTKDNRIQFVFSWKVSSMNLYLQTTKGKQ